MKNDIGEHLITIEAHDRGVQSNAVRKTFHFWIGVKPAPQTGSDSIIGTLLLVISLLMMVSLGAAFGLIKFREKRRGRSESGNGTDSETRFLPDKNGGNTEIERNTWNRKNSDGNSGLTDSRQNSFLEKHSFIEKNSELGSLENSFLGKTTGLEKSGFDKNGFENGFEKNNDFEQPSSEQPSFEPPISSRSCHTHTYSESHPESHEDEEGDEDLTNSSSHYSCKKQMSRMLNSVEKPKTTGRTNNSSSTTRMTNNSTEGGDSGRDTISENQIINGIIQNSAQSITQNIISSNILGVNISGSNMISSNVAETPKLGPMCTVDCLTLGHSDDCWSGSVGSSERNRSYTNPQSNATIEFASSRKIFSDMENGNSIGIGNIGSKNVFSSSLPKYGNTKYKTNSNQPHNLSFTNNSLNKQNRTPSINSKIINNHKSSNLHYATSSSSNEIEITTEILTGAISPGLNPQLNPKLIPTLGAALSPTMSPTLRGGGTSSRKTKPGKQHTLTNV